MAERQEDENCILLKRIEVQVQLIKNDVNWLKDEVKSLKRLLWRILATVFGLFTSAIITIIITLLL